MLLLQVPGWTLQATDPDLLIVDLHSHTSSSHDGIVSLETSLRGHRGAGFDSVAITEQHRSNDAYSTLPNQSRDDPFVLTGMEFRVPAGGHLLEFGTGLSKPESVAKLRSDTMDDPMIALAWRLNVKQVEELATIVDGFELVNGEHPDIENEVRDAVQKAAAEYGLILLGTSDWHGWGGFWRVWTTVRIPGAGTMEPIQQAAEVIAALKNRDRDAFQPVVAGYFGTPSLTRMVFAPWFAIARYATELSIPSLLSWCSWSILFAFAAIRMKKARVRPMTVILTLAIGVLVWILGKRARACSRISTNSIRVCMSRGAVYDH